jgi:hypothetical protein
MVQHDDKICTFWKSFPLPLPNRQNNVEERKMKQNDQIKHENRVCKQCRVFEKFMSLHQEFNFATRVAGKNAWMRKAVTR